MIRLCSRWFFATFIVGVMVMSCSSDNSDGTAGRTSGSIPAVNLTYAGHAGTAEVLEQQIGIDRALRVAELITDHVDSVFPYSKHRTVTDKVAEAEAFSSNISMLPEAEQQAAMFDAFVRLTLSVADRARSGDLAEGSGRMHEAYMAAVEQCARDHRITDVKRMLGASAEDFQEALFEDPAEDYGDGFRRMAEDARRSAKEYDQFAESMGLTRDELLDLRQSCSRYGATLPTLDADVREDLFRLLHQYYLDAVQAALAELPEATELSETELKQ